MLSEGSKAVIDSDDQYQVKLIGASVCTVSHFFNIKVFDDANASDPSHSLLSKVIFIISRTSRWHLHYHRITSRSS